MPTSLHETIYQLKACTLNFLSYELEEPIIKQYLDNCPSNTSYISHKTCDSFITCIDKYLWEQTKERLSADIVLFADETSTTARKEILGIFISLFDKKNKEFHMDFISLVEVSSTNSETVMCDIEKVLREKDIGIEKKQFCCIYDTNSISGKHNGVQRRIRNYTPHVVYINCMCHRLTFCLKHLMDDSPWLKTVDSLLLGLWKTFHFSGKYCYILKEIQLAHGIKTLNIIKTSR